MRRTNQKMNSRTQEIPYTVAILGIRDFIPETEEIVISEIERTAATKVITAGDEPGVCSQAIATAGEHGYPVELHFENRRFLSGAYTRKIEDILDEACHVVFIGDWVECPEIAKEISIRVSRNGLTYKHIEKKWRKNNNKEAV